MSTDKPIEFRRILVIRFHAIGDVLLTTPILDELRRRFDPCRLAMLTDLPSGEILQGHPALDELMIYNLQKGKQKLTFSDIARHWKLLRLIRSRKFDLAINLHPSVRGGMAVWLSGARCRVGLHSRKQKTFYYNIHVPDRSGIVYRVDYMMDALRAIGIDAKPSLPTIGLSDEERESVRPYIPEGEGPLVALHSGRADTRKRWIDERFAELSDALVSKYGARTVFIGDPTDAKLVSDIMSKTRQPCSSVAGKLGLKQLGAFLEKADLLIGIDSAPIHIASAVGTPSIALFGWSNPGEWNPPGARHIAIKKPLSDHKCNPPHCCAPGSSPCMRNIEVEDVLDAAERLLNLRQPAG